MMSRRPRWTPRSSLFMRLERMSSSMRRSRNSRRRRSQSQRDWGGPHSSSYNSTARVVASLEGVGGEGAAGVISSAYLKDPNDPSGETIRPRRPTSSL
jgi:hypothetical protein